MMLKKTLLAKCVHLARAVSPVHCQLRNSPGVEREAVGVRDVPVEHVELVVGHPGDDLLDDLHQKKGECYQDKRITTFLEIKFLEVSSRSPLCE